MKLRLVRLFVALLMLGCAACSGPTSEPPSGKPDPTAKPEKPPAPPPLKRPQVPAPK